MSAFVHLPPQRFHLGRETLRVLEPAVLELRREDRRCQQSDVLDEHREETAHEELRDLHRIVAGLVERARDVGDVAGDLARDLDAAFGRIERVRFGEDRPQRVEVLRLALERLDVDARAERVGELAIVARAVERRVEIEAIADVGDDQERRWRLDRFRVRERLAERFLHSHVPRRRAAARRADLHRVGIRSLLGLQHEAPVLVEIDEADRVALAAVDEDGFALEDEAVAVRIAGLGIRMRNPEDIAEIAEEGILIRPLRGAGRFPFGDKGGGIHGLEVIVATNEER